LGDCDRNQPVLKGEQVRRLLGVFRPIERAFAVGVKVVHEVNDIVRELATSVAVEKGIGSVELKHHQRPAYNA
jgi:hypothetical protein